MFLSFLLWHNSQKLQTKGAEPNQNHKISFFSPMPFIPSLPPIFSRPPVQPGYSCQREGFLYSLQNPVPLELVPLAKFFWCIAQGLRFLHILSVYTTIHKSKSLFDIYTTQIFIHLHFSPFPHLLSWDLAVYYTFKLIYLSSEVLLRP